MDIANETIQRILDAEDVEGLFLRGGAPLDTSVSRLDADRRARTLFPQIATRGTERTNTRGARQPYRRTVNSTAN